MRASIDSTPQSNPAGPTFASHGGSAPGTQPAVASDTDLALTARIGRSAAALEPLVERYDSWMRALVAAEARHKHLRYEDICDLQQESFLILLRLVADLDAKRGEPAAPAAVWPLLRLRIRSRVCNRARDLRRAEAHRDRSATAERALQGYWDDDNSMRLWPGAADAVADPAATAERREVMDRLRQALDKLDPADVSLLERRMEGVSLRILADWLDQPYHRLKERYRRLLAHLAAELAACIDSW